jgi:hypothetical protein
MSFTVTWLPDAEAELAELWLAASDRERIRAAADQIDLQLRNDPTSVGESRARDRRILIVAPLVVTYRVRVADLIVQIVNVQAFAPRE